MLVDTERNQPLTPQGLLQIDILDPVPEPRDLQADSGFVGPKKPDRELKGAQSLIIFVANRVKFNMIT